MKSKLKQRILSGQGAVFGFAAAALLLFTGIHNAWGAVAYHVLVNRGRQVNERPC